MRSYTNLDTYESDAPLETASISFLYEVVIHLAREEHDAFNFGSIRDGF